MRSKRLLILVIFPAAFVFKSGPAQAAHNPGGWIQAEGWNLLMPLRHGGDCTAGGPDSMLRNWVAPHDFTSNGATDEARAGDTWDDIAFGGAAASDAWGFPADSSFFPSPTWLSIAFLNAAFAPATFPGGDLVNFEDIVITIRETISILAPPGEDIPDDQVLEIGRASCRERV